MSSAVYWLAAFLVVGGAIAASWALWRRDLRRVDDLRGLLELAYLDEDPVDAERISSLLARSGQAAERALKGTSLLSRLAANVERSDYQLSPGELVLVSLAAALLGIGVGVGLGSPVLLVILVAGGMLVPYALVSRSVVKRTRAFESQFPDILDLIAASLESGSGVAQALELVVAESDDPSATEFARVLNANRLGTPLAEALQDLAARLDSRDLRWTVQAIIVQQQTGGRLAEVLRIVAEVMRARAEVRGEIRTLTAEGRLSAYVLGALPVVFAGFLALVRPEYLRPLYTTPMGLVMIAGGVVVMTFAFVAMLKIVKVEV